MSIQNRMGWNIPAPNKVHHGYNIGRGLAAYKAALANYGTRVVKVHCVGDSITRGEYSSDEPSKSWVGVLRGLLQARYGNAGEGFISPYEATLPAGAKPRWTLGAGWIWTGTAGFGGKYASSANATTASTVTFTGTSVTIVFPTAPGAGIANASIDGTAVGTYNCNGAGVDFTAVPVTFSGLAAGSHTLTITPQTTANVFVEGIIANNGTSGIQVHRNGQSGYSAGSWYQFQTVDRWKTLPPHLAIIALGMNDVNMDTIPTYKEFMRLLIEPFKAVGASVLLMPYFRPSQAWTTKWYEIVRANYDLADQYNTGLVDMYSAWFESYDVAQALGLFGPAANDFTGAAGTNPAHPSDRGYGLIAQVVEPHLLL